MKTKNFPITNGERGSKVGVSRKYKQTEISPSKQCSKSIKLKTPNITYKKIKPNLNKIILHVYEPTAKAREIVPKQRKLRQTLDNEQ